MTFTIKAQANKYAIRMYRMGAVVTMFRERSPATNRYIYAVRCERAAIEGNTQS